MRRLTALFGLVGCALVSLPETAHAWLKVRNDHNHTVWVSHAFSSVDGFLCGWDDGCNGPDMNDWRVRGWWALAAGGETQKVHGSGWGNALHDIYAECAHGHVWSGGGHEFRVPFTAYSICGSNLDTTGPHPDTRRLEFRDIRGSRCCGGTCPTNHTVVLQ